MGQRRIQPPLQCLLRPPAANTPGFMATQQGYRSGFGHWGALTSASVVAAACREQATARNHPGTCAQRCHRHLSVGRGPTLAGAMEKQLGTALQGSRRANAAPARVARRQRASSFSKRYTEMHTWLRRAPVALVEAHESISAHRRQLLAYSTADIRTR